MSSICFFDILNLRERSDKPWPIVGTGNQEFRFDRPKIGYPPIKCGAGPLKWQVEIVKSENLLGSHSFELSAGSGDVRSFALANDHGVVFIQKNFLKVYNDGFTRTFELAFIKLVERN